MCFKVITITFDPICSVVVTLITNLITVTSRRLGHGHDRRVQTHFQTLVTLLTLKAKIPCKFFSFFFLNAEVFTIDNTWSRWSINAARILHTCNIRVLGVTSRSQNRI